METYGRYKALIAFVVLLTFIFSSLITFLFVKSDYSAGRIIFRFGPNGNSAVEVYENPEHFKFITLQSNSMSPTIDTDDVVIALETEYYGVNNISVGDIIVFQHDSDRICHRVYKILEDGFQTKGDANSQPDSYYVYRGDVQAVVIAIFWK